LSISFGCGADPSVADPDLSRKTSPIELADLSGSCFLIKTAVSGGRYLDAYTSGNGDVVTRLAQGNDTQHWCFMIRASIGNGGSSSGGWSSTGSSNGGSSNGGSSAGRSSGGFSGTPYYAIAHRSFSGQVLDAYTASNGYKAVLRDDKGNYTPQQWELIGTNSAFQLRQRASGRSLTHSTSGADDFRAYTVAGTGLTWFLEAVP
jgi:hypothetical protein